MSRPVVGECWLWRGKTWEGYGYLHKGKRQLKAHRWVFEAMMGEIPEGLELDHLCKVRRCVNPAHLEPVTQRVNVLRSDCPPALNARKTHCNKGHEFTEDNTYRHVDNRRECRTCKRENASMWYKKKRAQYV